MINKKFIVIPIIAVISGAIYFLANADDYINTSDTVQYERADEVDFSTQAFPWLQEKGLTSMKNTDDFRPNDNITRGEAAKFFTKFAKVLGLEKKDGECNFSDISKYSSSFQSLMVESCKYGLVRGANGKFLPDNNITEAQSLVIIGRAVYDIQGSNNNNPWYSEYYKIGQENGLITDETIDSVETTNITREKLGIWLYLASQVDDNENISDSEQNIDNDTIVYETDVDGPDDCTSYEKYDSSKKVCTFECSSETECSDIEEQINKELDGWSDDLAGQDRDAPKSEGESTSTNMNVLYSVSTGEKIAKISGNDTKEYQDLWKEVADLSPDSLSDTYIENFEVYSDPSSDIIAYVSDDDGNGKWKMSINIPTHKQSNTKEQKITLIHELSHIITLNKEQFMTANGKCPNYETQEGCTKSTTYLNGFVKKFWGTSTTANYDESKFVTEYASSSPEEDIAESFAFFVIGSNFSETTIKDQKMNFFNQYTELVKMRNEMRNVLASDIIHARKAGK